MTITASQSSSSSSSSTRPTTFSTAISMTLSSTVPTTMLSNSIQSTTKTQKIIQVTTESTTMVSTRPTIVPQTAAITTTTSFAALPTEIVNSCWSIIIGVCLNNGELPDMSADSGVYANCPLVFKYFYCTLLKNIEIKPCAGMAEFCSLPDVTAGNPEFSSAALTAFPSTDTVMVSASNTTSTSVVVVTGRALSGVTTTIP